MIIESPIKVYADLTKGINAWLCAPIDAAGAVGTRLMRELDLRYEIRRIRNINLALPDRDDLMMECFDSANKRRYPERHRNSCRRTIRRHRVTHYP